MEVFYEYYPCVDSSQLVPQQGGIEMKPRRRRPKKCNGEAGGIRKLSEEQVIYLEEKFRQEPRLVSERKDKIGSELGLDPRRVAIWFQNRRARCKSKKLEEDYFQLKDKHATILVEKCRLENEVLKLKEELKDAEKKMQRLMEQSDKTWSNSPNSPLSMEPPLELGEFGMELDKLFYLAENNNTIDWII